MANGFMWFDVNAKAQDVPAVVDFYASVFEGPFAPDETDGAYMSWMMNGEQPWAAVTRTLDEVGFQFGGPGSSVLSSSEEAG